MRHYPVNSPHASARLVALAAAAQEGRLSRAQLDAVRDLRLIDQLDLDPKVWHEVLTCLVMDLLPLPHASWSAALREDDAMLEQVLGEVDDSLLQRKIFRLSALLAEVEDGFAKDHNPVRLAAEQRWGIIDEQF